MSFLIASCNLASNDFFTESVILCVLFCEFIWRIDNVLLSLSQNMRRYILFYVAPRMIFMYIHERDNWTDFRWDASQVSLLLEKIFRKFALVS